MGVASGSHDANSSIMAVLRCRIDMLKAKAKLLKASHATQSHCRQLRVFDIRLTAPFNHVHN